MNSPFPGMDPYLEDRWSGVHVQLLTFIAETLQPLLPAGLRARPEERVLMEEFEQDPIAYRSDIALIDSGPRESVPSTAVLQAPVTPVVVEFMREPPVDRWVQIVDTHNGNRVVTAIEVLSPGNKASGALNRIYRRKLADYARARVNVVEIDLLRSSRSRLTVRWDDIPEKKRANYIVAISQGAIPEKWECYPMHLSSRLSAIPIPLRESDSKALLELQPLIDRVYVAGGHDDIDYRQQLDPPLSAKDEIWMDQLRSAGRR
jgi:hypothetical protein